MSIILIQEVIHANELMNILNLLYVDYFLTPPPQILSHTHGALCMLGESLSIESKEALRVFGEFI